jgi:hypothetical protein
MKRGLITILAMVMLLAVAIVPASAQAESIYSGTGNMQYVEPVQVTPGTPSTGTMTGTVWDASFTGGGTATLVFTVKNNGTVSIPVTATATAQSPVTAIFNHPTFTLASGETYTTTLTVTMPASAAVGSYPITFSFTR